MGRVLGSKTEVSEENHAERIGNQFLSRDHLLSFNKHPTTLTKPFSTGETISTVMKEKEVTTQRVRK